MTQAEAAVEAGVSRQFIGALENGHPGAELAMVMKVGAVVRLKIG